MITELLNEIYLTVLYSLPPFAAIVGCVLAYIKNRKSNGEVIKEFQEVKQSIVDMKEYSELKSQLSICHKENEELKKKINDLIKSIDGYIVK